MRHNLVSYAFAILVVVVASIFKLLIPGLGEQAPTLLYLFVIFMVANLRGFYPAIFAAMLAALGVNILFTSPNYHLSTDSVAATRSIALLIEGTAVAWVVYKSQRLKLELEQNRAQLKESNDRITKLMEEVLDKYTGANH